MLIDTETWRAAIGTFNSSSSSSLNFNIITLKYLSLVLKSFMLFLRFPGIFICYIFLLFNDVHFILFLFIYLDNISISYYQIKYHCAQAAKKAVKQIDSYFHRQTIFILFNFLKLFLLLSGDVEEHPGPLHNLSILHWNLNGISVHNYSNISSLIAYNSIHKYDIICLSETFLDSTYDTNSIDLRCVYILQKYAASYISYFEFSF